MKNKFSIILLCVFTCVCSCVKKGNMPCPEENNQQAFEELQASLLSYETENGFVQLQDTKGFWSVLGRIVAADAFGFMFGSVGGVGLGTIASVVSSLSQSITELITYPDYMTKSALNDYSLTQVSQVI